MAKFLLMVVIVIFAIVWMFAPNQSGAMDACQKTHSYDTCFQLLNR
jgi:Tfp pilus assembly protein FimT